MSYFFQSQMLTKKNINKSYLKQLVDLHEALRINYKVFSLDATLMKANVTKQGKTVTIKIPKHNIPCLPNSSI